MLRLFDSTLVLRQLCHRLRHCFLVHATMFRFSTHAYLASAGMSEMASSTVWGQRFHRSVPASSGMLLLCNMLDKVRRVG